MKFCFFSAACDFGGGERYLSLLIPALRDRGHQVDLVLRESKAPASLRALQDKGFPSDMDTVLVFNGIGSLYRWVPRFGTRRASMYVHHSSLHDDQSGAFKRHLRPMMLRLFSANVGTIIRVCQSSLPDDFRPSGITTIYNGVPATPWQFSERRPGDPFTIAMVGAVNENKNQHAALDILSTLPANCRLKIIGRGPMLSPLQARASGCGLASRITWTGFTADPAKEFERCHAAFILSRHEAFPFAALELMSAGIPLISYPVGGLPELITSGHDGFIVSDPEAARSAALALCDNDSLRHRLADNASATIRQKFSLAAMADRFIDVARDTLARLHDA